MDFSRTPRRGAGWLLGVALLTGAAGCQDAGDPAPVGSPSPSPSSTPTGSASPTAGGGPSAGPAPAAKVFRGTVVAGVEEGCRILRTAGGSYVLVGQVPAVRDGAQVTVRGIPEPGTASICNQGTVLRVTAVVAP
ncbi:hypothetical protein GCM10010124_37400 [Pilimelia terevasa]|uniref:Lipoprotein n=1 Tax=Pilimelia terevasa TaxID=53372 RepID=A0A8J3BTI2_9ACTN|nr:hypothetical protein [Pilimelia terevasa]GGK41054.1 hypothetical protein GCM10010124_37400 [Pilimelia terevasa]